MFTGLSLGCLAHMYLIDTLGRDLINIQNI